jgi:MFS family permease
MRSKFVQNINWGEFSSVFIVVVNSISWYTLVYAIFNATITNLHLPSIETLLIFAFHFFGIAASAIVGAMVPPRSRATFLLSWIIVGAVSSVLLITIPNNTTTINVLVSLLLGVSFGIGLPSCLAYFADMTSVENRGLHAGVTWCAVGLGTLLLAVLMSSMDTTVAFLALAVWRGFGLIFLLLRKEEAQEKSIHTFSNYTSILSRADVGLYLVPWIMFNLVNFIEAPIVQDLLGNFYTSGGFVGFALTGVFALIGGFFSDIVGRKRVIITGFVVVGIEYAMLSLLYGVPFSWYVYAVLDGIAWGMFAGVFLMTLWGDLAGTSEKEKYYVIGGLCYILSGFLQILIRPYIEIIPKATAFSLASFFLFLAVLPLIYAPETLPEKKIQERELKEYVEKAKKVKEKYV